MDAGNLWMSKTTTLPPLNGLGHDTAILSRVPLLRDYLCYRVMAYHFEKGLMVPIRCFGWINTL